MFDHINIETQPCDDECEQILQEEMDDIMDDSSSDDYIDKSDEHLSNVET